MLKLTTILFDLAPCRVYRVSPPKKLRNSSLWHWSYIRFNLCDGCYPLQRFSGVRTFLCKNYSNCLAHSLNIVPHFKENFQYLINTNQIKNYYFCFKKNLILHKINLSLTKMCKYEQIFKYFKTIIWYFVC